MNAAPIVWKPPKTFDEKIPGLGLPVLEGTSHRVIFDPQPSKANVDEGGDGRYESLLHGNFCHGPSFVIHGDYILARWSNHTMDEGGPGSRAIARVGKFVNDRDEIDWGGYETLVELAPPPIAPRRRRFETERVMLLPYIGAGLSLINGTIYSTGNLHTVCGYTNEEEYRAVTTPIPEKNFRDGLDVPGGFWLDKWAFLGGEWVQRWILHDGRLVPDTPMYQRTPYVDRMEVTPGRWKIAVPLNPPYTTMRAWSEAPQSIKDDFAPKPAGKGHNGFRPGTRALAADGKNALAHDTEFRRPDGKLVSVRDNLKNQGHYYAAVRDNEEEYYPPAVETNLIGGANIASGTLPDGRIFIIGNNFDDFYMDPLRSRKDMYIALSKDGITFDTTYNILHLDRRGDGGIYKYGGPQYYKPVIIEKNMWIFYSITKMKIGLTKIPLDALR